MRRGLPRPNRSGPGNFSEHPGAWQGITKERARPDSFGAPRRPGGPNDLLLGHLRRLVAGSPDRPPTDRELLQDFTARQDQDAFAGARSRHPGGINVTMGDGSVRFVKSTISPTIWIAVNTINGGEVISADSY